MLAGREPADDAVARVRAYARLARACATGDARGVRALADRERAHAPDLPWSADPATLGEAATDAFHGALR